VRQPSISRVLTVNANGLLKAACHPEKAKEGRLKRSFNREQPEHLSKD